MRVRLAAAAMLALCALAVVASPASAHTTLDETTPANGARLATAPPRVVLRFTGRVEVGLGGVRVFDRDGTRVDQGELSHPGGSAAFVALELPRLRAGGYVVTWRVVSADSHPIQGSFVFTVGEATPADASDVARVFDARGDRALGAVYGVGRTVAFGAMFTLLGSVAFVATLWPAGARDTRFRRIAWGALGVLGAFTLLNVALQGGYAEGLDLASTFAPHVAADVLATRFGRVYLLRLVLLVAAAALLWALGRGRVATWWWRALAAAVGAAIAATPALAGHGAVGTHQPFGLVADTVHVGAGAVWLGGLVVLLAVARRVPFDDASRLAPRFSRVAFLALGLVVATGVFQAYRQVGSLDELRPTEFGRFLVVKMLLVAAVLIAAFFARRLVQRLTVDSVVALRRIVAVEAALAVGVLGATAVLVNAVPSRVLAASPQAGELVGEKLLLDYTVTPGRVGPNDIHLYVLKKSGLPQEVIEMALTFSLAEKGVADIDVPLVQAGPNHFQALNVDVPFAGTWAVAASARTSAIDAEVFEGTVRIRG